jgi:hypothetical protein
MTSIGDKEGPSYKLLALALRLVFPAIFIEYFTMLRLSCKSKDTLGSVLLFQLLG